jgi:hypothetical protein
MRTKIDHLDWKKYAEELKRIDSEDHLSVINEEKQSES